MCYQKSYPIIKGIGKYFSQGLEKLPELASTRGFFSKALAEIHPNVIEHFLFNPSGMQSASSAALCAKLVKSFRV